MQPVLIFSESFLHEMLLSYRSIVFSLENFPLYGNNCTHTPSGVYLSLRGVVYANNSVFQITEIGETNATSNTGLQCITDKMICCTTLGSRFGEWYFPDGTFVPAQGGATTFYRNRGDDGTVNLNRLDTNVLMPTGLFCCEVPDASGRMQRLCASIGELKMNFVEKLISFPSLKFRKQR